MRQGRRTRRRTLQGETLDSGYLRCAPRLGIRLWPDATPESGSEMTHTLVRWHGTWLQGHIRCPAGSPWSSLVTTYLLEVLKCRAQFTAGSQDRRRRTTCCWRWWMQTCCRRPWCGLRRRRACRTRPTTSPTATCSVGARMPGCFPIDLGNCRWAIRFLERSAGLSPVPLHASPATVAETQLRSEAVVSGKACARPNPSTSSTPLTRGAESDFRTRQGC